MAEKYYVHLGWMPRENNGFLKPICDNSYENLLPPGTEYSGKALQELRGYSIGSNILLWTQPDVSSAEVCGKISSIPSTYLTRGVITKDTGNWQSVVERSNWRPRADSGLENYLSNNTEPVKSDILGDDFCIYTGKNIYLKDVDHWLPNNDVVMDDIGEDVLVEVTREMLSEESMEILSQEDQNLEVKVKPPPRNLPGILKDPPINRRPSVPSNSKKNVRFEVLTHDEEDQLYDVVAIISSRVDLNTYRSKSGFKPKIKTPLDEVDPSEGGYRRMKLSARLRRLGRSELRQVHKHKQKMLLLMYEFMYSSGLTATRPDSEVHFHVPSEYIAQSALTGWRELRIGPNNSFEYQHILKGSNYYVATTANGGIYAWGANQNGTLGINSQVQEVSGPVAVIANDNEHPRGIAIQDNVQVMSVSTGSRHCIATLMNSGELELWGWGSNRYGRLGNGVSRDNNITPIKLMLFAAIPSGSEIKNKENTVEAEPRRSTKKKEKRSMARSAFISCMGICVEEDVIHTVVTEFDRANHKSELELQLVNEDFTDKITAIDTSWIKQVHCQDVFSLFLLQDGRLLIGGMIIESDLDIGNFPLRYIQSGYKFDEILKSSGVKNWIALIDKAGRLVIMKLPYTSPHGDVCRPTCVTMHKAYTKKSISNVSFVETAGWAEDPEWKGVPYDATHLIIVS